MHIEPYAHTQTNTESIYGCVCAGPGGHADDELETFVNTIDFKLPKVVYDWTASPPPPPPATFGAFHDLAAADPEGMELLREKLVEFWPSLT